MIIYVITSPNETNIVLTTNGIVRDAVVKECPEAEVNEWDTSKTPTACIALNVEYPNAPTETQSQTPAQ